MFEPGDLLEPRFHATFAAYQNPLDDAENIAVGKMLWDDMTFMVVGDSNELYTYVLTAKGLLWARTKEMRKVCI